MTHLKYLRTLLDFRRTFRYLRFLYRLVMSKRNPSNGLREHILIHIVRKMVRQNTYLFNFSYKMEVKGRSKLDSSSADVLKTTNLSNKRQGLI